MKRILVIGSPGAGKSTFSKRLAKILDYQLIHLDNLFWLPDKSYIGYDEFEDKIKQYLDDETWIIDGNYSNSLELRLRYCDTVILLDYDLNTCVKGIKERVGIVRGDIPWKEDKLDEEFFHYVLEFPFKTLPKIKYMIKQFPDKELIVFKNREEANRFLLELERS